MKTKEQALTEWVNDEILFDYCNGRGPLKHNRDQFIKVCAGFKIYTPTQAVTDDEVRAAIGSGGMLSTGFVQTGGSGTVPHAPASTHATIGPVRDDITELVDWSVSNHIKSAAFICADFFSPVMVKVSREVLSKVQTLLEPRNVAQFASAKELVAYLMETALKHENA